jgi:amino acid transporter
MVLEQEIKVLVILGFSVVLAIVAAAIFMLWRKTRNRGLLWFLPQLALLALCLVFFLRLIDNANSVPDVMLSEENSLMVGLMGSAWCLSMIVMVIGIIRSLKNGRKPE